MGDLRDKLQAIIQAGEKATPRPWETEQHSPMVKLLVPSGYDVHEDDGDFIALSANSAEALARFAMSVLSGQNAPNASDGMDEVDFAVAQLARDLGADDV